MMFGLYDNNSVKKIAMFVEGKPKSLVMNAVIERNTENSQAENSDRGCQETIKLNRQTDFSQI